MAMVKKLVIICITIFLTMGCGKMEDENSSSVEPGKAEIIEKDMTEKNTTESEEEPMEQVKALAPIKNPMDHNPVMTQAYSADPYAIVYDGRVYLYMTADKHMYESDGKIKKNDYSNIDTLHVISSDDLVNWTDHGEIMAAGKDGAANWGGNSWAPAACWKMIDGKPKFFLYFANSGNGIAVLTSDSPVGPFVDPIGEALVSRRTPTCAEVAWLFDPAVLIDDDGTGYLYFGGGIPSEDMIANPGTARVVKLTEDMIHLDGDPKPIDNVLYLFEDSGINKLGDKYIYSYCSNFNVPRGGCEGYGFESGEIVTMVGDSPMGPFETVGGILKNPEHFFKFGGNNHHCMFEFDGKWYVTYHASLIEEKLGENNGYRSVNIDEITIGEDGLFAPTKGTKSGVSQLKYVDPFKANSFATMANQMGIITKCTPDSERLNSLDNCRAVAMEDGAFIQVSGVDFDEGSSLLRVSVIANSAGSISIRSKMLNSADLGQACLEKMENAMQTIDISLTTPISDIQDVYFVFTGSDIELVEWMFVK